MATTWCCTSNANLSEILNLVSTGLKLQQIAEQTSTSLYKIEGTIKSTYRKIAGLKS